MKKTAWLLVLIIPAILVVAGFQGYWLADTFQREKKTLGIKVNTVFDEMTRRMQDSSLQSKITGIIRDTSRVVIRAVSSPKNTNNKTTSTTSAEARAVRIAAAVSKQLPEDSVRVGVSGHSGIVVTFRKTAKLDSMGSNIRLDSIDPENIKRIVVTGGSREAIPQLLDSMRKKVHLRAITTDTLRQVFRRTNASGPSRPRINGPVKFSYRDSGFNGSIRIDSILYDTLPVDLLTRQFGLRLDSMKADIPFSVIHNKRDSSSNASIPSYQLSLGNTTPYLLKRLTMPIIFSIGLVSITLLSFFLLYAGLKRQQRLAAIKQEFISNITHELKTPIATVGVAIEALRNFNALNDPARTREYLDISRNELQRLSLLVDKVLKLSMFEKKEIELRPELVNLEELVKEVAESMRLQLEKQQASLSIDTIGECTLSGDRLHLQSLIFNLVDNALKYSSSAPQINIQLHGTDKNVKLEISDNGIGIPPEYRQKVFEKFFRVPHGDTHNAKGHGLGLSYVAQVVAKHHGTISIEAVNGGGTRFIIHFPK
ncbi:HAMP domain-containing histidine kinase [Nostoc ellipsosporum NOK]|nr:HAMP domain-containing histidine kinase [Nostoc ellipsosporum NOK]